MSVSGIDQKKREVYGILLKGAQYVKIYDKNRRGSFTIPDKVYRELWEKK
jgi:hypothetical protein